MKKLLISLLLASASAGALEMKIDLTLPEIKVSDYHKPYVAGWIEGSDRKLVEHLFVWYDVKGNAENPKRGLKWLKDLRNWWRKGGRSLDPIPDGVSGATRKPGSHSIEIKAEQLAKLKEGDYTLQIEATREEGGTERVSIPFKLPLSGETSAKAAGKSELGDISLTIKP